MRFFSCIAAALFLLTGVAHAGTPAAAKNIQLPPETVKLRPSRMPGYAIALQKCAICHSADYISYQPPGMDLAQWTAETAKMRRIYGAPLSDGEIQQVGAYLAVAYGAAKAGDPAVLAASAGAAPAAGAAAIDVQALLAQSACLSCHGLTQKIVGPSYHDIGQKYKADPQAQSRLEASIRKGSTRQWGDVPMPPFAALKPEELKALAAFVLAQ